MTTISPLESRRQFLAGAALSGLGIASLTRAADTPRSAQSAVKVLFPRGRVPLSFIIDDSTCLVNMGHFCTPQFAAAWPGREIYQKGWKAWPREIPDAFVREFGEWCATHGVKGKYSIVPNPACVGWLDRELPGWSRPELLESLKLVRDLMLPNWDIHPEMITHTRVIDLKTGRPIDEISAATMENSYPQEKKSVDELAAYLAYALRILKNCDLPCEGITTPGGFGNMVKPELAQAAGEALRDVYATEIPHYFKYVHGGDESTEPRIESLTGRGTNDVRLTVNVPAGTGDWFGGWQGDRLSEPDRYATADASGGRMVDLITAGRPALMLCHWPGMYSNGSKEGFHAFQRVVMSIARRFGDRTIWMKLSEIARYWAARELTEMTPTSSGIALHAPFAAPDFTVQLAQTGELAPHLIATDRTVPLKRVARAAELTSSTWFSDGRTAQLCFDLPRGKSVLRVQRT